MTVGIGAAAVLAVLVIAANIWPRGSTVAGPPASSTPGPGAVAGGPISDLIRHSWQRPLPVTPGEDHWATGFLSLVSGPLDYGPEPGPAASRSAVAVVNLDTLEVTATVETQQCAVGDLAAYRWSVEGKDTVMTLTAISPDACAAREKGLAGSWVRSDLPVAGGAETTLPPGTHLTSAFDPFGKPGTPRQLSYTVPKGWAILEDRPADFVLYHLSGAASGPSSSDTFIILFAQPRFVLVESGAPCEPPSDAPDIGQWVDDIAAAVRARAGVVSTPPTRVTVGGHDGQILDLQLAPSWTGVCQAPEGQIAVPPFLLGAGPKTGPTVGVSPDHPLRLILLDLADGRTMAVAIFDVGPIQPSPFEEQVASVMPIIESFQFQ